MTGAVLYLRQSISHGERSISLDLQEAKIRDVLGDTLVLAVHREPNVRGWAQARPHFDAAIADAITRRANLAVYDLSRFARRLLYQEQAFDRLSQHGLTIISATEPWIGDPMVRQILGSVAEQQTRTLSGFLAGAKRQQALAGVHIGPVPPLGYLRPAPGASLIPAPLTQHWPEQCYRWHVVDNLSYAEIARRLVAAGVPRDQTSVRMMLRNPTYLGHIVCRELIREDAHPPLVPRDLWEAEQALHTRVRRPGSSLSWLCGITVCACGAPAHYHQPEIAYPGRMTCATMMAAGPSCGSRPLSRAIPRIEAELRQEMVATLSGAPDARGGYLRAMARYRAATPDVERRRAALVKRQATLELERDRLLSLFTAGRIDQDRWLDRDVRYAETLALIGIELARVPAPPELAVYTSAAQLATSLGEQLATQLERDPAWLRGAFRRAGIAVRIQPPHLILPAALADVLTR